MIEEVRKKSKLLALIIRNHHECEGVDFLTPNEYSQQVAYMHHPQGKVIDAHVQKCGFDTGSTGDKKGQIACRFL